MCTSQVYLVSPGLESRPFRRPWQQKNGMGTINTNIFDIDGAHGMFLLPRNTKSALNRISSEPGLLKIPCGPWHLGRAWAGPGPGQGCWGRGGKGGGRGAALSRAGPGPNAMDGMVFSAAQALNQFCSELALCFRVTKTCHGRHEYRKYWY